MVSSGERVEEQATGQEGNESVRGKKSKQRNGKGAAEQEGSWRVSTEHGRN